MLADDETCFLAEQKHVLGWNKKKCLLCLFDKMTRLLDQQENMSCCFRVSEDLCPYPTERLVFQLRNQRCLMVEAEQNKSACLKP